MTNSRPSFEEIETGIAAIRAQVNKGREHADALTRVRNNHRSAAKEASASRKKFESSLCPSGVSIDSG